MHEWQGVLDNVLATVSPVSGGDTQWAVIGSVATALHGCGVEPGDIDLLAKRPAGVYRFAELMTPFTPDRGDDGDDHANWHSSLAQPVDAGPDEYGFYWYFARWFIDGVKLEIAHIVGPELGDDEPQGIWEAGPAVWAHIREVPFGAWAVPLVPLEVQLATNWGRGREERAQAIAAVLQRDGYDHELLARALSREQLERFMQLEVLAV